MSVTQTLGADISRYLLAKFQNWYKPNWEAYPKEYAMWNAMKSSPTLIGTYDTMGNLAAAISMLDGADITYTKIQQAYETSVTSAQYGTGFVVSWQAQKVAKNISNMIEEAKVMAIQKSMLVALEAIGITPWNNAFATTLLSDGVYLCSNSHPCKDAGGVWDNLTTGAFYGTGGFDAVVEAVGLFSQMLDHQAKPVPSFPDTFKTHAVNQLQFKALAESAYVPKDNQLISNTIPSLKPVFSHYLTSKTAWFLEDTAKDRPHGIFQYLEGVETPENKVEYDFLNRNFLVSSLYFAGANAIPNVGLVGSLGT